MNPQLLSLMKITVPVYAIVGAGVGLTIAYCRKLDRDNANHLERLQQDFTSSLRDINHMLMQNQK